MAPLLTLGLKLLPYAGAIPEVIRAFGGDNAAEAADKAIGIAKALSGQSDPEAAVAAVIKDPSLQLDFQKMLSAERLEFERMAIRREELAVEHVKAVNVTMQAEAKAEHWMQYAWRPFNGFSFGITVPAVYVVLPLLKIPPPVISPEVWMMWGAVLGITAWHRGQEKVKKAK